MGARFFEELARCAERGQAGTRLSGLVASSRALVLVLLAVRTGRKLLLVTPGDAEVEAYQRDLAAFAGLVGLDPGRVLAFPALDADPYDAIAPHPEVQRERVVIIDRLLRDDLSLLIVPARALLHPLPAPGEWRGWTRTVRKDDTLPPERFLLDAIGLGYRRVDIVSAPGEVSRRGGIVDIFPPTEAEPIRIELFGDSVDSLRSFDTDNQRSTGQLEEAVIGPAVESPPTDEATKRLSRFLRGGLRQAESQGSGIRPFRQLLDQLRDQGYWPGIESLARLTSAKSSWLFDYAAGMLLVVDEPDRTDDELIRAAHDQATAYEQSGNRVLPPPAELFGDPAEIRGKLGEAHLFMQELIGDERDAKGPALVAATRSARAYDGRMAELVEDLRRAQAEARRTVCVMRAEGSADRLRQILGEYGLDPASAGVAIEIGSLRDGVEFTEPRFGVLSERNLFGEERESADRKRGKRAPFISDFRDLKMNDMLVHVDHGIARYRGLGRPKGGSLNRDFMVLEYSGGDRLFVPVDRLDLVQKYSGVKGHAPALDRLGGPGWERVKRRVRKSVESMARELLELYARRRAATGHAFSPDSPWQTELEAAFPFELTPDQVRALEEIKRDMESERPVDRLLVGDVGFGKTELAVRAAFKAAMDGFQVALLAPTTVLAFQHYQTFRERFAPFPVRVEMVSRFRSPSEVKGMLEELALGSVDVVIGTHRLLSKDVRFKRLGLLVVDEEQRFGVSHKERLKRMSVGVDVLAMTATPIPRTLQMSLAGVRDLSIIETPPPGRMAIQTYLIPFRKNVLAQAVRQELRREGQVFIVHNKIETLPALARVVGEMAPGARIVVAHSKMPEKRLEEIMLRFVRHEADILLTTTIIENGLDIPRANTIIVNRADRFGLAQLYQLRGRVGRSHHHAYAYFVIPSRHTLSGEARSRLRALQEFSELGAGFRLAAADLEIRGAGELLGSKQHGHIASLGFDLYCQMLERAVQEQKGEPVIEAKAVNLHLGVDIKIEESYLPDSADRLVVYKRLAQARTVQDVDRLQAETEDRYGHLPPAARSLFEMGRLRSVAERAGVKSIDLVEDQLQIRFYELPAVEPARVLEVLEKERGSLTPSGMVKLPAPPRGTERIRSVARLLRRMLGRSAA